MKTTLSLILLSTFAAFFLIDVLAISLKIKKLFKLDVWAEYKLLKPLECPTCLSFHLAWILSLIMYTDVLGVFTAAAGAWLLSKTINKI